MQRTAGPVEQVGSLSQKLRKRKDFSRSGRGSQNANQPFPLEIRSLCRDSLQEPIGGRNIPSARREIGFAPIHQVEKDGAEKFLSDLGLSYIWSDGQIQLQLQTETSLAKGQRGPAPLWKVRLRVASLPILQFLGYGSRAYSIE